MFRPGKWILTPFVILAAATLGGCLTEADRTDGSAADAAATATGETWVEAWDASGAPGLPTPDQLRSALSLTDEQAAVVQAALTEWARNMEQHRNVRAHGVPGGFGDLEPPMLAFLQGVIPALDAGQVRTLATILERNREQLGPMMGDGRHPGGRPGGPRFGGPIGDVLRDLRDELDLDDAQRQALAVALHDSRDTFHALRRAFVNGEITAEELRDAAKAARVALETQLATILNDDQYALLMNALAERRSEMATRRLEHLEEGVQRRIDFLTTVLSLDDAQAAQVQSILLATIPLRQAILEGLRDGTIAIEDALYQGYVIARDTSEAIRALLTPEQQEIFDALKQLLPGHRGPHAP